MRLLAIAAVSLAALVASGCSDREFMCSANRQCIDKTGASGLCLEMRCAYPSNSCASGYVWDDAAGSERAGTCVSQDLVPADAGVADAPPTDARPADAS
jgi:hypothetical protein